MLELTEEAKAALDQPNIEPQIILDIDGFPYFSATTLNVPLRYGDPDVEYGDTGLFYGGTRPLSEDENKPLIMIQGTTSVIKQQIVADKGGSSSVTTITVRLIDLNDYLTEEFNKVEMLARGARFYIGFQGTSHPEDSVLVASGTLSSVGFGSGFVDIVLSSSEEAKRRNLFLQSTTDLDGAIDSSTTTVTMLSTSGFYLPSTNFATYIRIDDEIIQYTGTSGDLLTGVVRGALGTTAASHDDEAGVETNYRLYDSAGGNEISMIELVLQLYLSGGDEYYLEDLEIKEIGTVDGSPLANAVYFSGIDIKDLYNIIEGDSVTITTGVQTVATTVGNVISTDDGSYFISNATLTDEISPTGTCKFESQYNVLPDGVGLKNQEVDIDQFLRLNAQFSSSFPQYDILLKETKEGKDFIDTEILLPANCNSIPRDGKLSITAKLPPLAIDGLVEFNNTNVLSASSLKTTRSITKNFYNTIVYKFAERKISEKFAKGVITVSGDSQDRIRVGTKSFDVEAPGVGEGEIAIVALISKRLLDRYKFSAETIKIGTNYKIGFPIEIGDIVVFDGASLQVSDTTTGTRDYTPRLMEVINKELNFKTGRVGFEIQDTAFGLTERYGIVSPSSNVVSFSAGEVVLSGISSDNPTQTQGEKWEALAGEKILIHDAAWTYEYTATIVGRNPSNDEGILITDWSGVPSASDIIQLAPYTDQSEKMRRIYVFLSSTTTISSGTSDTVFDVTDASIFYVGGKIRVNNTGFTNDSDAVVISNIVGTQITVETSLGFTPSAGETAVAYNFKADEGESYFAI